jgi:hypothetical protein
MRVNDHQYYPEARAAGSPAAAGAHTAGPLRTLADRTSLPNAPAAYRL